MREVENLRDVVIQQNKYLEDLSEIASIYGVVIGFDAAKVIVASNNGELRCNKHAKFSVAVGDVVVLLKQTHQILEKSERSSFLGDMAALHSKVDDNRWTIDIDGTEKLVVAPGWLQASLEAGSRVVLDATSSVIMELLPHERSEYATHSSTVKWDDIGGHEMPKQELKEAIALIRGSSEIFKAYNAKPPKGILLYGPPGNGKTMLGKAVANELAEDGDGAFMYIKAPELLSKYVGASEERIRSVFKAAKAYKNVTGKTAVVFIDEADAILQKRGSGVSSDVEKTIVPAFLTEMDGLEDSGALVILATNRPDTLDEAVIRDGRIDRRIRIGKPDIDQCQTIFAVNLNNLPLAEGLAVDNLSAAAAQSVFDNHALSSKVSGAMIASAVSRAKTVAIRRDVETNKVSGVSAEDLLAAINDAAKENVNAGF